MLSAESAEQLGFNVDSPEYSDIERKARVALSKLYRDENRESYHVELVIDREGGIVAERFYRLVHHGDGVVVASRLGRLPKRVREALCGDMVKLESLGVLKPASSRKSVSV